MSVKINFEPKTQYTLKNIVKTIGIDKYVVIYTDDPLSADEKFIFFNKYTDFIDYVIEIFLNVAKRYRRNPIEFLNKYNNYIKGSLHTLLEHPDEPYPSMDTSYILTQEQYEDLKTFLSKSSN